MDIHLNFEIAPTAAFIHSRNFSVVGLQFPEELYKYATKVTKALRKELRRLKDSDPDTTKQENDEGDTLLIIMCDHDSCCVDEVQATRLHLECVVHYGHTCLSQTSVLPAYFVFGHAVISISDCVRHITDCAASTNKPILVLYGLEYAYEMQNVRQTLINASIMSGPRSPDFAFADVACSVMDPPKGDEKSNSQCDGSDTTTANKYSIGGLKWNLPDGHKIEDYLLFWIGSENSAFSNVVLTFNGCEIVRYDAADNHMVTDFLQLRRILKRRYYLVEKAKDANIIGILVGTLAVAGYLKMIHQIGDLIAKAGKKAYLLVTGRPNPAKLANFPQCDVIIYVSCAQTALLDSKEFLAPVITPFEAMLAFNRGSQWTGEYVMDFHHLINSSPVDTNEQSEEPRYSFFQCGYVEDVEHSENDKEDVLALSYTIKALELSDKRLSSNGKRAAKTGAEFFATRSYQGLEIPNDVSSPEPYVIGRSGKASGYADEKSHERS